MQDSLTVKLYKVRYSKRDYEILVFPISELMVGYDNFQEDGYYMVDADIIGYNYFRIALATLDEDPSKIIYFPTNRNSAKQYLDHDQLQIVFCMQSLQLKKHEWKYIRQKIDGNHFIKDYTINVNHDKIMADMDKLPSWNSSDYLNRPDFVETAHTAIFRFSKKHLIESYASVYKELTNEKLLNETLPCHGKIGYLIPPHAVATLKEIGYYY